MPARLSRISAPLLLIVCSAGTALAGQHLHAKVKSGETKIQTVLILPARVDIAKVGVKGAEPMLEEQELLTADVENAVMRAFSEHGIRIAETPYTAATLEADRDLRYRLADFQARHDRLMEHVLRKKKDIAKGRFSIGDEILDLVSPTDADAVVFVRASATHRTLGARFALDLANPHADFSASARKTIVRMTLVHPETGEVLGLFETTAGANLDKPLAKAVRKLPK